jgi:hypothetical protein
LSGYSQEERKENIKGLLEWRDTSLSVLKAFDQNKGVHVIFVSKKMLERDPEFEKSLLEKAKKQQDLVVMGFDGGFAVAVLNDNVASIVAKIFF